MIAQSEPRVLLRIVVFALLAAMLALCWIPRLSWGLWLDETFTVWQSDAGFTGVTGAKLENPGQSTLYARIESLFYHPRSRNMELFLRIPSILGALVSCFFVYRLGDGFVGPGGGLLALVPFAARPDVIQYACEARPYTLATAACLGSLWGLHEWLKTGMKRYALLFSISTALIPYLHLIYVTFLAVPAYMLFVRWRQGRPIDVQGLLLATGLTVLLWIPLIPFLRDFLSRGRGMFPSTPSLHDFLGIVTPRSWILLAVGFGMMLAQFGWGALSLSRGRMAFEVGVVWWLGCPALLVAVSLAAGQTLLIERYLLHIAAAQSLVLAVLFSGFPRSIATLCMVVCFVPLTTALGLAAFSSSDGPSSWRLPLRMVREMDPDGAAPVFVQSGHPMSNRMDWQYGVKRGSYLYSQLSAYPLPNPVYPLPFSPDGAVRDYLQRLATDKLGESDTILYVGRTDDPIADWLREFLESDGYQGTTALRQGLSLIVFRKQHPAGH